MPDRLYFTESDEANALIAADPMALLVGFELDQRVTVMKAFQGPLALKERLGAIDAATLASADLEPVFFAKPVIHRYPRSMAKRVHELAVHVRDRYGGDAARVWTDAADSDELRANLARPAGLRRDEDRVAGGGAVQALRRGGRPRARAQGIRRSATWIRHRRSRTTRRRSGSPQGRVGEGSLCLIENGG